ncbi:MAG: lipid-binding SYLF domain-containing protein [Alphaproteobacteria bacterium]
MNKLPNTVSSVTRRTVLTGTAGLGLATLAGTPALADRRLDAQALITQAQATVQNFRADTNMQWVRTNLGKAKAVLVVPQSVKGGFIIGGSGGTGVLMTRRTADWSAPAFYTIGSFTFGLQIGGEVSELLLMVMTDRGVERLLTSTFKLGADLSVAAGPVGAGAKAQTVDVLAFARTKGLYGGINVEGAVIKIRNDYNEDYYDRRNIRPRDILTGNTVSAPEAAGLRQALLDLER